MFFKPDPTIFPKTEFDAAVVRERLEVASYLNKGLRIAFDDETSDRRRSISIRKASPTICGRSRGERSAAGARSAVHHRTRERAQA